MLSKNIKKILPKSHNTIIKFEKKLYNDNQNDQNIKFFFIYKKINKKHRDRSL